MEHLAQLNLEHAGRPRPGPTSLSGGGVRQAGVLLNVIKCYYEIIVL